MMYPALADAQAGATPNRRAAPKMVGASHDALKFKPLKFRQRVQCDDLGRLHFSSICNVVMCFDYL
jgi:hypothetical protein